MNLKKFKEFISNGIVRKQTPNNQRAFSLLRESEEKKKFLEFSLKKIPFSQTNANFIVDSCYDILIELIRAKIFIDGYNSSNSHEAEVSYMENLGFSEVDIRFMNEIRFYRNSIKYYGRILDKEYAKKVLDFMYKLSPLLQKLIDKNNSIKLITLNVWGGRIFNYLIKFLKQYSKEIDIFCFQEIFDSSHLKEKIEIRTNLFREIKNILTEFNGFFAPAIRNFADNETIKLQDFYIDFGLAIFIKNNIKVNSQGDIFVFKAREDINKTVKDGRELPRNLQYIKFNKNKKEYIIANVHGIWTGGGKEDTQERIEQSKKIKDFLDSTTGSKILCGDFNLLPQTESLIILEKDMRNLVKEYEINSTRSHFYKKEHKFADYILISKDINVKDFKVINEPVSDHLPLYLEFN